MSIRSDFPLISTPSYTPFCYADNAASTQQPQVVIEAMQDYAQHMHANIHRSPYRLAENASILYENARKALADRFHIAPEGVVFCSGATAGLNLLANSLSQNLKKGDGILLSLLDHHSMIVPWQQIAKKMDLNLYWAPYDQDTGIIDVQAVANILNAHPEIRIMSIIAASNAVGTRQPVSDLADLARKANVITIVDGCQTALEPCDLKRMGVDYWVISAHKMFGPTGIGAIMSPQPGIWDRMPVAHSGGGSIQMVSQSHTLFAHGPAKFEPGTPPIQAAYGWMAAIRYIGEHSFYEENQYIRELTEHALPLFTALKGYQLLFANSSARLPIFSLTHQHIHPHDLATYLDHMYGIATRAGHHCAMPLMESLNLSGTLRFSFTWYNTLEEVDYCIKALEKAEGFFNV